MGLKKSSTRGRSAGSPSWINVLTLWYPKFLFVVNCWILNCFLLIIFFFDLTSLGRTCIFVWTLVVDWNDLKYVILQVLCFFFWLPHFLSFIHTHTQYYLWQILLDIRYSWCILYFFPAYVCLSQTYIWFKITLNIRVVLFFSFNVCDSSTAWFRVFLHERESKSFHFVLCKILYSITNERLFYVYKKS